MKIQVSHIQNIWLRRIAVVSTFPLVFGLLILAIALVTVVGHALLAIGAVCETLITVFWSWPKAAWATTVMIALKFDETARQLGRSAVAAMRHNT